MKYIWLFLLGLVLSSPQVLWTRPSEPKGEIYGKEIDSLLNQAKQNLTSEQSLSWLAQGASLSRRRQDTLRLSRSLFLTGMHHQLRFEFEVAQRYLDSVLCYLEVVKAPSLHALTLLNLHANYEARGMHLRSLEFASAAWEWVQAEQLDPLTAPTLLRLGNALRRVTRYREARQRYQEAEQIARAQNDSLHLFQALNNLSVIYQNFELYSLALTYSLESIQLAARIDSMEYLMIATNIGYMYLEWSVPDKAIPFFRSARKLAIRKGRIDYLAKVWGYHAQYYFATQQMDSARYAIDQMSETLSQSQNTAQYPIYCLLESNLASMKGNQELTATWTLRAQQAAEKQRNEVVRLDAVIAGFEQRYAAGGYAQVIQRGKSLLRAADTTLLPEQRLPLYEAMVGSYRQLRRFEEADALQQRLIALHDSIDKQRLQFLSDNLLAQLGAEEKERENQRLRDQNQLQANDLDQQNRIIQLQRIILLGLALGAIVVSCLLFLLWRSKQRQERLNHKLDQMHRHTLTQKQALEQSNQIKDRLLSVLSHDLRGPVVQLDYLLGYLLTDDISPQKMRSLGKKLSQKIDQTILFMDGLLLWASQQVYGGQVKQQTLKLSDVVAQVIELHELSAQEKEIQIRTYCDEWGEVSCDPNLLRIVLRNLLHNALKFTPKGGMVTLSGKRLPAEKMVRIEVKDNGLGISAEQQRRLFIWKSESRQGTNQEPGTGLGLSLCREFVVQNGGEMGVCSKVGEGSTFFFTVPAAKP